MGLSIYYVTTKPAVFVKLFRNIVISLCLCDIRVHFSLSRGLADIMKLTSDILNGVVICYRTVTRNILRYKKIYYGKLNTIIRCLSQTRVLRGSQGYCKLVILEGEGLQLRHKVSIGYQNLQPQ